MKKDFFESKKIGDYILVYLYVPNAEPALH